MIGYDVYDEREESGCYWDEEDYDLKSNAWWDEKTKQWVPIGMTVADYEARVRDDRWEPTNKVSTQND